MSDASLYGVEDSNRIGDDLWGKNQFNSTFPVALCCYMRDNGIKPVYISVGADFDNVVNDDSIAISDVFGTSQTGSGVRFEFETESHALSQHVTGPLGVTDLVTIEPPNHQLRALEIKLTVVPDASTSDLDETAWAPELVIRPITSAYATLGMWDRLIDGGMGEAVRRIVEPVASKVQSWDNRAEMSGAIDELTEVLGLATRQCHQFQRPFLIQPIWKTEGQSPQLAAQCFDVFVWSDLALWKLFVDGSARGLSGRLTRVQRECVRTVKCLYDLSTRNRISYEEIYRGIALGNQTDKACSFSGKVAHTYMQHPRLVQPVVPKSALSSIILGGGEAKLSPERRFDASIYFAWRARLESAGGM